MPYKPYLTNNGWRKDEDEYVPDSSDFEDDDLDEENEPMCAACNGTGESCNPDVRCSWCNGSGVVKRRKK